MNSCDSSEISIANIPPDVLHRIVEISLPSSLPDPISSRVDASKFFTSTPPYSFALTCRAWRNVVLTSHILWSSLFLSFDLPREKDCAALIRMIDRHLDRAGRVPLICHLRLSSRYDDSIVRSRKIVMCLCARQTTWKRIALYMGARICRTIVLDVKDLKLLEELYVDNSVRFLKCGLNMPSLTHLELNGCPAICTMDWFRLTPNLKDLRFSNVPTYTFSPWFILEGGNTVILPELQSLYIHRASESSPFLLIDLPMDMPSLAAGVLNRVTCHALTALQVILDSEECDRALLQFLQRSKPPLEVLNLDVRVIPQANEYLREEMVLRALACVPSVRELRLRWDMNIQACPGHIMRVLSLQQNVKLLLPALEIIELTNVIAPLMTFVDTIYVRCRAENRTLKSVSFFDCYSKSTGLPMSERRELGDFESGGSVLQVPIMFEKIQDFVSDGLEFRIVSAFTQGDSF
ncbi:hypothetical protein SCHPADRAFT_483060 [Schizopora paradoxa]|uniref:F-box domain-containing protein n=1 Tax=Schizopora paradoxa TaxID=27342 RepID=A0A0H2RHW8_9AGAM|nr:hypothetical protein SCHPADRAFT_483060 [Schizopora paradoxa]